MNDPIDQMPPGPFLGRRSQLARLCRAVEEARLGHGARLWIVGPAGIGKSRLLAEVAQYAAWRRVPVDFSDVDKVAKRRDRDAPRGPGLLIVDPVPPAQLAGLDDRLRHAAMRSKLALATTASRESCLKAGIAELDLVVVTGLEPADSLRLFEACLGSAFDPDWARRMIRSTAGHPARIRRAAAKFRDSQRGGGAPFQTPPQDGC